MVTVTAKFHNPSLSRRKEWQQGTRLYRDTKQFCINGWENGNFGKSVTTSSIDNALYRRSRRMPRGFDMTPGFESDNA